MAQLRGIALLHARHHREDVHAGSGPPVILDVDGSIWGGAVSLIMSGVFACGAATAAPVGPSIEAVEQRAGVMVLSGRARAATARCGRCQQRSGRVHGRCQRSAGSGSGTKFVNGGDPASRAASDVDDHVSRVTIMVLRLCCLIWWR